MDRPRSVRPPTARRTGAVDWIAAGLTGLLLVSATACASPATAPAAATATGSSPSASAPPAATPPSTPATDGTPLDSDAAPGVTAAGVGAPNPQPAFASKALDVLATIPIKGRAPKTGYSRDQFGQAWADVDRNGCDTRNDMLRRDLTAPAFKPGTRDCVVLSGVLNDPYTATLINFLRGNATSTAVQIDHVVALSDAWQKGAQQLTPAQRLSFANDPLNLLAVDGPANMKKSDGDAATWLPPNKSYRCTYVARQISVKASYTLWVTQAEHDAMARTLGDCPDAPAPTNQEAPPPPMQAPAPAQQAVPAPAQPYVAPAPAYVAPVPVPAALASAYYANCAAVRAAGAAPLHAGQPGYRDKLDGDRDGTACE
ncbi:GmrSD restriction endonuclease domain-containing protein [Arthrobacter sp. CG_A4]|uniref:GmrSD restriction endonuclease domain-containing protein n=1 Tax=Arthrobacter sp. CG_A4 TaxID=3071706 RepID=UPI003FA39628